jgi:hypothetical protein
MANLGRLAVYSRSSSRKTASTERSTFFENAHGLTDANIFARQASGLLQQLYNRLI